MANPKSVNLASERIGERRMMNCGVEAEIIAYTSAKDITVKFADGTIARNKAYDSFKKGKIQNPNLIIDTSKRVGERRIMNCGMEAEIIEYKSCSNITVKFSDTTVVCHKSYEKFIRGRIKNPNIDTLTAKNAANRIGECRIMTCGMKAEIIGYNSTSDITVRFSDGTVVPHKAYGSFLRGNIANPNCSTINTSIGETALRYYLAPYGYEKAPCGSLKEYELERFEIDAFNHDKGVGIEYDGLLHQKKLERDTRKDNLFFKNFKRLIRIRDFRLPCNDKRVEYYKIDTNKGLSKEYEETLKNVFRDLELSVDVNFKRDKDKIYDFYYKNSPRTRLGEKRRMNSGFMAEIIKYRSAEDIDVRFEDGIIKNTRYTCFVSGKVAHPNHPYQSKERLGMRRLMKCGMYAEVIQYNNAKDITVRFDDGAIVSNRAYDNFSKGMIRNPTMKIGEKHTMHCRMQAEIIDYKNANDITVKFEDGTISEHKKYGTFKNGGIANPNV